MSFMKIKYNCSGDHREARALIDRELCHILLYFFLKHFSGPESGILEFDWLLTRVPPVQFFPIRTGFVMVTARIYRAKTIE